MGKSSTDFIASEHHRQAALRFGFGNFSEIAYWDLENIGVEENERAESGFLSRGRDVAFISEEGEEGNDGLWP
jgi:hypothetical protein